jgi:hypothetical protein
VKWWRDSAKPVESYKSLVNKDASKQGVPNKKAATKQIAAAFL